MKKLRVYLETSFWNYLYADEYPEEKTATKKIFCYVKDRIIEGFISRTVIAELENAPEPKRTEMLKKITDAGVSILEIDEEVEFLVEQYLIEGVIPERKRTDAYHVSFATVYELDVLLTWNQRHLANLRKRELIFAVNLKIGYSKPLEIITPEEVIIDETEQIS